MTKAYTVNLWGSKPGTNDNCWTGADFDTIEEARACFSDPRSFFLDVESRQDAEERERLGFQLGALLADTAWFELDGHDLHEERENPSYKPSRCDDEGSEHAMQMGMGLGVDAYNDAMGY